jgi:hypothetical protein
MKHVLLVTGNKRYGEVLRPRLKESGYTADVCSLDAAETKNREGDGILVLDAHAALPRSKCVAVQRVRAAREQDIGTPFVILTWLPRRDIVNAQLASNPFIGHFYKDSCRFLRLPVRPERLIESLREVRPCTKEEIATGKCHLAGIDYAHRTSAR